MVKVPVGSEVIQSQLKAKIRLDYKGESKPTKFLFGGKNVEEVAEETREQKVAMLRNVPVYVVQDDLSGNPVAYAPVQITVSADSIEDLGRFIVAEEFRKIEILDPEQVLFTRQDIERLLFKLSQDIKNHTGQLERKYSQK
jgi:hypothetical protein